MAHTGPNSCQFEKWNCRGFINNKKYKIVFKIRKDYLRINFFAMAIYETFVSSKFASMQDLENNNWIILDPLRDIYDI